MCQLSVKREPLKTLKKYAIFWKHMLIRYSIWFKDNYNTSYVLGGKYSQQNTNAQGTD